MKRIFVIGLTLLLLLSSLGHVFAAAFCRHPQGHECCLKKASNHLHESSSSNDDMSMDGMVLDDMAMNDSAPRHTEMPFFPAGADAEALTSRFHQPVESCSHCMNHSGVPNAPVSFVSVPDQSSKESGSILLPVLSFRLTPAITIAQSGPARQHGPPGRTAPRNILICVLLI
jgi:hypothetical protein